MSSETTESTRGIDFLAWLEVNQRRLIAGVVAAALLASGIAIYWWRSARQETAANSALVVIQMRRADGDMPNAGPKPAELLELSSNYAGTTAGQRALLLAAEALFREGKFEESQAAFEKFRASNAGDPLASTAAFGSASCLDALGKTDAAIAAYRGVIESYPESATAAHSKLTLAGLLESTTESEQALQYYDQLRSTAWMTEAEERRKSLLAKHPELAPATNDPATMSMPGLTVPQAVID